MKAKFFDDKYSDNSGSLSLKIYGAPQVSIEVTDAEAAEPVDDEDADNAEFEIRASSSNTSTLNVRFSIGGTATADSGSGGGDYQVEGATDLGGGQWSVEVNGSSPSTVTVVPLTDEEVEGSEDVELTLQEGSPGDAPYMLAPATGPASNPATKKAEIGPQAKLKAKFSVNALTEHDWQVTTPQGVQVGQITWEVDYPDTEGEQWAAGPAAGADPKVYREKAKVAGELKVRAKVVLNGKEVTTNKSTVNVNLPNANEIVGNAAVRAKMDAAWDSTKSYSKNDAQHRAREEAFWIKFNTETAKYEFSDPVITGEPVLLGGANLVAGANVGQMPADNPASPRFGQSPTYTVGVFHTHVPIEWVQGVPAGNVAHRLVGPSAQDQREADALRIPAFAYDYVGAVQPIVADGTRVFFDNRGLVENLTTRVDDPAKVFTYGSQFRAISAK